MSASAIPPPSISRFQTTELNMLAKTADALSAYLGKPVLAEVDTSENGLEWVTFGIPLEEDLRFEEEILNLRGKLIRIQMGGPEARLLGNHSHFLVPDEEIYDCLYLWAIQITLTDGEHFVKLDQEGEKSAWSDTLADVLPFVIPEDNPALHEAENDDPDKLDQLRGHPSSHH